MTIPITTCPDKTAWQRFLLGEFSGKEAEAYEIHLTSCDSCSAHLREFDADDEFVSIMRRKSDILELLETTERLSRQFDTDSLTSTRSSAESDFLDAPQQSGEMGRFAGYRVIERIGRGGSGVVYLAEDERLGRRIALKIILENRSVDADHLARFEREAQLLGQLQHESIVRIYEVGSHRGRPFLALEHVGGGSLADRLHGSPWDVRTAARVVRELALGVQYAHGQGVLHRDLKPGNVLIVGDPAREQKPKELHGNSTATQESFDGRLKIADFGLARRLDDDGLTQTGEVLGTPGYLAPEQLDSREHSKSATVDIYSLGAILYELLVGRRPFRGGTILETLEQARQSDPVSPRRLRPTVPKDIETICLKCLERDPKNRYPTAAALVEDLTCFLDSRPIHARRIGIAGRILRWAQRRPGIAVLALLLVAVAGASLVGAIIYEWRLRDALGTARDASERAERKRLEAEFQARRADGNYNLARDTVQKMLLSTKNPRWNDVPRMQELRRQQAEAALTFFEGISAQVGKEFELRADVAWAKIQISKLKIFLGRSEEAIQMLQTVLPETAVLLQEAPDNVRAQLIASDALLALGSNSSGAEAKQRTEEGVHLLDAALRIHPDSTEIRSALIDAAINLGGVYVSQKEYDAAEKELLRAIALVDQALSESPDDAAKLIVRARARINLAAGYRQAGRSADCQRQHSVAETELEQLYNLDPTDRYTIDGLAVLRINGAYDLQADNRPTEAAEYVLKNVDMLKGAMKREPDDPGYRDRMYRTYGVAATMLAAAEKTRDAAEMWENVVIFALPNEKLLRSVERVDFWMRADDFRMASQAAEHAQNMLATTPNPDVSQHLADTCDELAERAISSDQLDGVERTEWADRFRAAAARAREMAKK